MRYQDWCSSISTRNNRSSMSDWRMTSAASRSGVSAANRRYPRMTSASSSLSSSVHRRRRRRRGTCRAVGGNGRATPDADWSSGTFEGGIRRQRRKNDKNEEREDLTYSLHVWCGASSRRRASRRRACADPFGVGDARRHLPPRSNLDQTTPTEGRHFCGERLSEHRCNCWSLAIRRRSSLCRLASASVRLDKKWWYAK